MQHPFACVEARAQEQNTPRVMNNYVDYNDPGMLIKQARLVAFYFFFYFQIRKKINIKWFNYNNRVVY